MTFAVAGTPAREPETSGPPAPSAATAALADGDDVRARSLISLYGQGGGRGQPDSSASDPPLHLVALGVGAMVMLVASLVRQRPAHPAGGKRRMPDGHLLGALLARTGSDAVRSGGGVVDGAHPSARAQTVYAMAGHWVLPWVCLVAVSATLAHAAEQALTRALVEQPAASRVAAESRQRPPADARHRWVVIASSDDQASQQRLTCRTRVGHVSADVLQVRAEDLESVADQVCLWTTSVALDGS
jgi:hypothetical protein